MHKKTLILIWSIALIIVSGVVTIYILGEQKPEQNKHSEELGSGQSQQASSDKGLDLSEPDNSTISLQKYSIVMKDSFSTFIAPSFINDQLIAFEMDVSEKTTSYIGTFSRINKQLKNIYQTQSHEIINSLVGVNDQLFWVEYGRNKENNTAWTIKSLNLLTNKTDTLRSGISEDDIDPPILRVYEDQITWIEKEIKESIVYSHAILFNPSEKELFTVVTTKLNEKDGHRNGVFLAIQRPIKEGMLIQQSVFKTEGEQVNKTYEVVLYPYDKSPPIIFKKGQGIIDFTANDKWFVWSEMGKISISSRKNGEVIYTINGKDKDLTIDSPFIVGDHLYYRYSMYQIMDVDLMTGKEKNYLILASLHLKSLTLPII